MGYIEGQNCRQIGITFGSIEDEISDNSPARFIEVFVEALHMKELGFSKAVPSATGRPAYDPRDMIKMYLYGYLNGIRSSRKLERECWRNVELFYLLHRLRPDHNTIADFRKDNRKALKKLFVVFVNACKDMKLISAKELCLDGTTIDYYISAQPACQGIQEPYANEVSWQEAFEEAQAERERMSNKYFSQIMTTYFYRGAPDV